MMAINIEQLKRLHEESTPPHPRIAGCHNPFSYTVYPSMTLFWTGGTNEGEIARFEKESDAELICYLRNHCTEIIEALEFSKNRDEAKV